MLSIEVEDVDEWFNVFFKSKEFGEALGIVWRFGSITDGRFKLSHKNHDVVRRFADLIKTPNAVYSYFREDKNYTMWICKISVNHPFIKKIKEMGWTSIKYEEKVYPIGDFDQSEFIKTYIKLHNDLGIFRQNLKGKISVRPRLRIHGSFDVLSNINVFLQHELGTSEKKIQTDLKVEKTKSLYFYSKKEIPQLLMYINASDLLEKYYSFDLGIKIKES